jgi:hypothetical protein
LIFLAFIVPLALYFLMLAHLNRSQHPVLVSGPWDFVGVLFAASGFLLLGGPAVLTGLHEQWRLSWLLGQTRFLDGVGENWYFWVGLWGVYFFAVVGGASYLLWARRAQSSIYNIDRTTLDEVLALVLERLGYEWVRGRTGRIFLRPGKSTAGAALETTVQPLEKSPTSLAGTEHGFAPGRPARGVLALPARSSSPVYRTGIDVEHVAFLRHATLHWVGDAEELRPEVEAELVAALTQVYSRENPASAWFLSVSMILFAVSFLGLVALLAFRIFHLVR